MDQLPSGAVAVIDVIVPCYNYGRYLRECLDSVLGQRDVAVRVLIIDDASPDGSGMIAQQLGARDPRVQVIVHDRNRGHIETYNEGLAWATAEHMLLLSADDLVAPGAFQRAMKTMRADGRVGLVYGGFIGFSEEVPCLEAEPSYRAPRWESGRHFIERLCANPVNPIETATAIVRTATQKRVGPYRPALPHAGDLEMWLRFAAVADLAEISATQALVRQHGRNMRMEYFADGRLRDIEQRHDAFRLFFAHAVALPDATRLARQVAKNLAEFAVWSSGQCYEAGQDHKPLLALAKRIHRPIRWRQSWWRQSLKRMMGPRLWRMVALGIRRQRNTAQALR